MSSMLGKDKLWERIWIKSAVKCTFEIPGRSEIYKGAVVSREMNQHTSQALAYWSKVSCFVFFTIFCIVLKQKCSQCEWRCAINKNLRTQICTVAHKSVRFYKTMNSISLRLIWTLHCFCAHILWLLYELRERRYHPNPVSICGSGPSDISDILFWKDRLFSGFLFGISSPSKFLDEIQDLTVRLSHN